VHVSALEEQWRRRVCGLFILKKVIVKLQNVDFYAFDKQRNRCCVKVGVLQ
jgi:hypothetical protein